MAKVVISIKCIRLKKKAKMMINDSLEKIKTSVVIQRNHLHIYPLCVGVLFGIFLLSGDIRITFIRNNL